MSNLEDTLKSLLQRRVSFELNNKTLREGRLIIFHIKDFYVSFILETEKHPHKLYEIPAPFEIKKRGGDVVFDYRLRNAHRNETKLEMLIHSLYKTIGKKSKFFDNTLTIKIRNID